MSHLDRAFIRAYARETAGLTVRQFDPPPAPKSAVAELPPSIAPAPPLSEPLPTAEPPTVEELYAPQVESCSKPPVAFSAIPTPHAPFFAARTNRATLPSPPNDNPLKQPLADESQSSPVEPSASASRLASTKTIFRLDHAPRAPLSSFLVEGEAPASQESLFPEPLSLSDLEAAVEAERAVADPVVDSTPADDCFNRLENFQPESQHTFPTTLEPCEAAFEVGRFAWPQVCTTILDRLGAQFEQLTAELLTAAQRGQNVIAFAGSQAGAGSTSLLLCVAQWLARHGRRVALVDGDFEGAGLANRLGLAPEQGWPDVFARHEPLSEALIESVEDQLKLLPLARPLKRHTDTTAWFAHVNALRQHHDLVLVDSGMVLGAGAAWSCPTQPGAGVDATILVIDMRKTNQETFSQVRSQLDRARLAWWGAIENFAPAA